MNLLDKTIASISGQNIDIRNQAKERLDQLIMPHWALGKLMDLALDLAGMTETVKPEVKRKRIVTMAGDHGITVAGVSQFPTDVTVSMIAGFLNGVAGVNVLARQAGTDVNVVDMGVAGDLSGFPQGAIIDRKVAPGTNNFAEGPAMSREQAIQALEMVFLSLWSSRNQPMCSGPVIWESAIPHRAAPLLRLYAIFLLLT